MRRPPAPALFAVIAAAALLAACGGDSSSPPAVVPTVVILSTDVEVAAGDAAPLAAVVLPDPGVGQEVVWSSADTAVARVASTGGAWTVRGVARGTTSLTAASLQDPTRTSTTTVTVFKPPTLTFPAGSLQLSPPGVLGGTTDLLNVGDRPATGVALVVGYPLGTAGWLTASLAGTAPHQVEAFSALAVTFAADPALVAALPSGFHVATIDVTADFGIVTAGNPLTVLVSVP